MSETKSNPELLGQFEALTAERERLETQRLETQPGTPEDAVRHQRSLENDRLVGAWSRAWRWKHIHTIDHLIGWLRDTKALLNRINKVQNWTMEAGEILDKADALGMVETPTQPRGELDKAGYLGLLSELLVAAKKHKAVTGQQKPTVQTEPAINDAGWPSLTEAAEIIDCDKAYISKLVKKRELTDNSKSGRTRKINPATILQYKKDHPISQKRATTAIQATIDSAKQKRRQQYKCTKCTFVGPLALDENECPRCSGTVKPA